MTDHASRIRAQQGKAANRATLDELERRSAPLLWAVGLTAIAAALGLSMYTAGHTAALRECPPVQQGERLLSSEQRADGAVCRYAENWADYGRKVKSRKVKS
jgi:hypothetical protein